MEIKDPAFNYDLLGQDYSGHRRTDPRIAAYVHRALGSARTVLNVGAGAGSYEPEDRYLVALEPSSTMRLQRNMNRVPALIGKADAIPFDDAAFDASMAMVTVHHWPDIAKGLKEMRRVTKEQVVIMSFDPALLDIFWNVHYFPELIDVEKARYPETEEIREALGGSSEVIRVPVPLDCVDGFQEAFYGRPEAFLREEVRRSQSAWGFLPQGLEEILVKRLSEDLASGGWDKKYGTHRTLPYFSGSLTLVVAKP